jgi:hypothetical protein
VPESSFAPAPEAIPMSDPAVAERRHRSGSSDRQSHADREKRRGLFLAGGPGYHFRGSLL